MTGKNKYFIRSRISERKFREIIKLFSADLTAQQITWVRTTWTIFLSCFLAIATSFKTPGALYVSGPTITKTTST